MNAPYYTAHEFHLVNPSRINLIHHGCAIPGRTIENLIAMMRELDERFHLRLMLVPVNQRYFSELRRMAGKMDPARAHFLDPVAPEVKTKRVKEFDIGIPLMRADKLSYFHALPNKFFEYIVTGLGIAVSPLPEMERIVRENQIGIVSPDQSIKSMVRTLISLSSNQIDSFKRKSLSLAKTLNGDVEMQKLMDIYAGLLSA